MYRLIIALDVFVGRGQAGPNMTSPPGWGVGLQWVELFLACFHAATRVINTGLLDLCLCIILSYQSNY